MKLLNKLLISAVAVFCALAAHADDAVKYEAKSVTVSNSNGSVDMTLLGTTSDNCQIWACLNTLGGGTDTKWTIDGTTVSTSEGTIYPNVKTTLTSVYDASTSHTLAKQTDLYQYVKIKSQTSAELIFGSSTDTAIAYEDFAVQGSVAIKKVGNYTFNSDYGTLTQGITWEATGIAGSAIAGVTVLRSYDDGQSWPDSTLSSGGSSTANTYVFLPNNVDHVRYKVLLHPYAQYRTVMAQDQWESTETSDYDISPTSRVVCSASKVMMKSFVEHGQEDGLETYYNLLGITGNGYQIWGAKLTDETRRFHVDWRMADYPWYYLTKQTDKFEAKTIHSLKSVSIDYYAAEICSGADYTHFIKVNPVSSTNDSWDYFSWKYEENSTSTFKPAAFQIAGTCWLSPTGDYSSSDDGDLSHDVTYTVKNANSLMLDKAVVEFSCDGGATWTTSTTVTDLSSDSKNTATATIAADHIPLDAAKVRYRLTVYPKNDYTIVCDTMTYEGPDYPVVRPTDEYNNVWVYKRVLSEDELIAGDLYLIVNSSGKAIGYQDEHTRKAEDVTLSSNKLKIDPSRISTKSSTSTSKSVTEFTLGGEDGKWTFQDKVNKGYLNAAGSQSETYYYLETKSENGAARQAAITIGTTGNATITFGGEAKANTIGYNSGTHLFTCYPQTDTPDNVQPVQLYHKISAFTITDAGYSTYYTNFAYTLPAGLTGYTVTCKEDNTLSLNISYIGGKTVPALTPLLIKGNSTQYNVTAVNSTDEAPADNLLHGTLVNKTTYADGNNLYYKLSKPANGKVGFYWGAENGAAFTNAAYKAYLVLPKTDASSQLRGFSFDNLIDSTVAVETVTANGEATVPVRIHNLDGRRISTLNGAQKGLYIVNGKKVLVK